jgi:hypothetical protein
VVQGKNKGVAQEMKKVIEQVKKKPTARLKIHICK